MCRGRLPRSSLPNGRWAESFADDLNTRRGIVSGRVALLPRSTEIQPLVAKIHPPPPIVKLPLGVPPPMTSSRQRKKTRLHFVLVRFRNFQKFLPQGSHPLLRRHAGRPAHSAFLTSSARTRMVRRRSGRGFPPARSRSGRAARSRRRQARPKAPYASLTVYAAPWPS